MRIKKISNYPFYYIDYQSDYYFHKLVKSPPRSMEEGFTFYKELLIERNADFQTNTAPDLTGEGLGVMCSSFFFRNEKGEPCLARNLDWEKHKVFLVHTKPKDGFESYSMADSKASNLFNLQTIHDMSILSPFTPFDGINSKGVAISMMYVPEAEPYHNVKLGTIGNFHLIRLVLDYAKSLDHALQLIRKFNVDHGDLPIHYLIADCSGKSAVIEHNKKKMFIINKNKQFNVATNFVISDSNKVNLGTCYRYDRIYRNLHNTKGILTKNQCWSLLKQVSQYTEGYAIPSTIWSTVYNLSQNSMSISLGKKLQAQYKVSI